MIICNDQVVTHGLLLFSMVSLCSVKMNVFLVALLVVAVRGRKDCDQSGNGKMQEEFTDCATKLAHAHHLTRDQVNQASQLEAATCILFSQTIGNCGKAWEQCHGREDIRKMKDMYINHLVSQYGAGEEGIDVNQCDVVKEYR